MATTRLYAPRPYDEFDSGVAGVAPILSTGTDVDNTKVTAVQAAATASGIGTLPTSAGGTAPAPVAEPLRFRGPWQINTVYSYGDVVSQGGSLYVAPSAFTSGSSFVVGNWTKLGPYDATDPSFSTTYATLAGANQARAGWTVGVMNALTEGIESTGLTVLGDSTGYTAGKTRWTDLIASWVAAQYPAYGVQTVRFDEGTQTYLAPTQIQAPPNGTRSATISGKSITHPGDGTVLNGQIEVEVDVDFNNPTNNVLSCLVNRSGGTAGSKQFYCEIKPSAINFFVSEDGSLYRTKYNTTVAPFMPAAGVRVRYRMQFNPNNGGGGSSVAFFYSTDNGGTWTQIGATWTNAFTVTLNQAGLVGYEAGGQTGSSEVLDGHVYGVWVRNGYKANGGLSVVPSSPDLWSGWDAQITLGGSPMFTLVNGSLPGRGISYLNASTARVAAMTPTEYGSRAVVLNNSHNDVADANSNPTTMSGGTYLALWDAWLTNLRSRLPDVPIAVTIQNHRQSPAQYIEAHRARGRALRSWAARNSLGIIDVRRYWQELMNAGTYTLTQLVDQTDTYYIHPSDAIGSPAWAALVEAHLLARA